MTTLSTIENIDAAWNQRRMILADRSRQVCEARDRIMRSLKAEGIPNTRHEEWKYTSLRPLLDRKFDLSLAGGAGGHALSQDLALRLSRLIAEKKAPNAEVLVFADGRFELTLSDKLTSLNLMTLSDAEREFDIGWWDQWPAHNESGRFIADLTSVLALDGVVISVPKNVSSGRPLHIFHIATGGPAGQVGCSRILIDAGQSSDSVVIEEYLSLTGKESNESPSALSLSMTQIRVGSNALVDYCRVVDSAGSGHLGKVSATLDRSSRLRSFSLMAGAKLARTDIDVKYTAPDAECRLDGLYLVNDGEHADFHTSVDHKVDRCRTHQLYKGILRGAGKAVFNGKIFIRKGTLGSEAYQTNKNLLLSESAEVNTKPQLEIDSDDVKASHGAAIGSIDPAELFYLRSRCIGDGEAVAMLCRGFADDVVLRNESESITRVLADRVAAWFEIAVAGGKVV